MNEFLAATSSYYSATTSMYYNTFFSVFTILFSCIYIIFIAYMLFGLIINTLALLDVANRSTTEVSDKTMWILLFYPFGSTLLYIPSFIYYFHKRKKLKKL